MTFTATALAGCPQASLLLSVVPMSLACMRPRHSKRRSTGQRRIEPVDKVGEQHLAADLQKNVHENPLKATIA
jgi:hypothetical protein